METPFEMSTGDFTIAYSVSGRLRVDARAGAWINPLTKLLGPETFELKGVRALSVVPGKGGIVGGPEGRAHQVILDPEGAVYHRALGEDALTSGNGRWTSLGGQFEGPLTVVASEADSVSLFGLSPDGAVLHKAHSP